MVPTERSYHKEYLFEISTSCTHCLKVISSKIKFSKNGSNSKMKVTVSKIMKPRKGLITRNTHVKYKNSNTRCSVVISKIKVFKKWVKLQGEGHMVRNNGTHGKVLSQGTCKISKSSTYCSKIIS